MPQQARALQKDNETLLDVCEYLHGVTSGAGESRGEEEDRRCGRILQLAILYWQDPTTPWEEVVKLLCRITLEQWEAWMRERQIRTCNSTI